MIDDDTLRQMVSSTLGQVDAELATERMRGRLVHATPDGYRTYVRQTESAAVITTARPGGSTTVHEVVGVDAAALT